MFSQIRSAQEELKQGARGPAWSDGQDCSEGDCASATPKGQASMKAGAAIKSLLGRATTGAMPPELIPVDWIMQRWWITVGGGMPTDVWDDNPKARLPPLDPDTGIIVDREYLKSPPLTKRMLRGWYSSPVPTSALARDWGMSERTVERGLHVALNFMRYRFESTGHAPLISLLNIRIDPF